jgi:hypothetical protein
VFRSILQKPNNKGVIKVLRSVEVLRSLNIGQLQRLADTLSTVSFADSEHAIQQGNVGDEFFIITHGNVRLFHCPNEVAWTQHAWTKRRIDCFWARTACPCGPRSWRPLELTDKPNAENFSEISSLSL